MPDFRRYYIPNAIVFVTCVTNNRQSVLRDAATLDLYWQILRNVQQIHPFHLFAYAIMPDHFHWLMQTPEQNPDFSKIVHSFKRNFTLEYKKAMRVHDALALWQPRFWDHIIRDALDLERHTNYIHYNPIKHGVAKDIDDIKRCSYRFWDEKGYYPDGLLGLDTDSGPFGE